MERTVVVVLLKACADPARTVGLYIGRATAE
jgi:hypothetical protein